MDAWFIVIIIYSCEVLLSSITLLLFFFLPLFSCSKTYGWWTVTQMCGGIPRTFAQSVSLTTKASSCLLCTPYVKGQALCNKSVLQCITNPNSTAMRATAWVCKVEKCCTGYLEFLENKQPLCIALFPTESLCVLYVIYYLNAVM